MRALSTLGGGLLNNPTLNVSAGCGHIPGMRKSDVICPECSAGLRRIEVSFPNGTKGEFRCPLCDHLLEVLDGTKEVAYRMTVVPQKILD